MKNVFVSRPTWIPANFQKGLDSFLRFLEGHQLRPRTLGASDYANQAPLDEVISLMSQCDGAIILGYPQIEITKGTLKGGDIKKTLILPTEWNHIEAGLAYAKGLPLLVIHHINVQRGIFDRGTFNSFIYEKDLSDPGWPLFPEISGAFNTWKLKLKDGLYPTSLFTSPQQPSDAPICKNCSTNSKYFYLSPIPKEFIEFENATHECTKCGFKANFK